MNINEEKPILFNTEMVRAILDGRKTVTRRVIKGVTDKFFLGECIDGDRKDIGKVGFGAHECGGEITFVKPPYMPGDILYVRETWYRTDCFGLQNGYIYKASVNDKQLNILGKTIGLIPKWQSSIHMPKEAARIFLKVTDVRVEQLQDMERTDFLKEGLTLPHDEHTDLFLEMEFKHIWDSTIKKKNLPIYGWEANPWVFVIEFERIEKSGDIK